MARITNRAGNNANDLLKIGSIKLDVAHNSGGPSDTSGKYNGIDVIRGQWVIYSVADDANSATSFSVRTAVTESELLYLVNSIGAGVGSITDAYAWAATNDTNIILEKPIEPISTENMVLYLDAAHAWSYPKSGSAWYNINAHNTSDQIACTIEGGTFIDQNDGYISLDTTSNQRVTIDYRFPSEDAGVDVNVSLDSYTTEVFFRMRTLPTDYYVNNNPIFGARIGSDYMMFVYPWNGSVANIGVSYDDSRNNANHRSNAAISANEWVHFVHIGRPYNNNQGTLEYWINGVQDRAEFVSSDSNGYAVPNRLWLGYDDRWKIYSDLDVAYVRMYKGELSPAQIRTNYALTKARFIDGGGWTRFWWYDGTTGLDWPPQETATLGYEYGQADPLAHYGFQRLPSYLEKDQTELLAIDGDGNIYKWDFANSNATAQYVWNSLQLGTEGRWPNGGAFNPTVIEGAFFGTQQDSWQYREEHGVKSFLLDDDTCDCKSTLNAGHAMCGGGWNQTYAQPAGAEYRYGVDTLNDGGCLGPIPTRKLELFFRTK